MWRLTYYYNAPHAQMDGTIEIGGKTHRFSGKTWFEHQWGNFNDVEANKYFWGYIRLNDGRTFSWRIYHKEPGLQSPDEGMSRLLLIEADGSLQYAFGPSITYAPTEWWASPATGIRYPWIGTMETPFGNFYLSPESPDQETPAMYRAGAFIEGVMYAREASQDGPIVGTGFVEMVDFPMTESERIQGAEEKDLRQPLPKP